MNRVLIILLLAGALLTLRHAGLWERPDDQIARLERFAGQLERAQQLPQGTRELVRAMIERASVNCQVQRCPPALDERNRVVTEKLAASLQKAESAVAVLAPADKPLVTHSMNSAQELRP